ncbi:MAG: phosphoribosylanthranilate isomerase [Deltaproteobacteria bacterium]|nr:phosphoribosylanthranilate isomerase [Deltaproteobacteria bacterium]
MTQIKICGITNIDDAFCAAACGADAVGFIFHRPSPRCIAPARAREIAAALPREIVKVGVFVNRDAGEVAQVAAECGLDLIQLHGDESPEYCRRFSPERLIKGVFLRTPEDLTALDAYDVRAFLADFREPGRYGGTGKRSDWGLAAKLAKDRPLILAGGLGPDNIGEALAAVSPAAVDVNSGCEIAPGVKDHEKMRQIVAIVRRAAPPGPKAIFGGLTKGCHPGERRGPVPR